MFTRRLLSLLGPSLRGRHVIYSVAQGKTIYLQSLLNKLFAGKFRGFNAPRVITGFDYLASSVTTVPLAQVTPAASSFVIQPTISNITISGTHATTRVEFL